VYVGYTTGAPVVADMDQDGQKEIVVANRSGILYIIRNNGSILLQQSFGEQVHSAAAVSNLDGDANLEVVFGTMTRNLHVVKIDGSEVSGFPVNHPSPIKQGAGLGDLTGNGTPEIVFGLFNNELHVLTASGDTLENFPITLDSKIMCKPVIAHIKTETTEDRYIVVITDNDDLLRIGIDGSITTLYSSPALLYSQPSLCDINKDDVLDILLGTDSGKLYAFNINTGDSLTNFPVLLEGKIRTTPVFADFNGDGVLEIAVSSEGCYLYVLNSDGSNYTNFPALFDGLVNGSPCIADVDNDGDFEVITGGHSGLNVIDISGSKGSQKLWRTFQADNRRTAYYKFETSSSGISDNEQLKPTEYSLSQNYPNPFNPATTIAYSLASNSKVELTIYNLLGQKVRALVSGVQPMGVYKMNWDGKNDNGRNVVSGIYIYQIKMKGKDNKLRMMTKKMLLLK
ncbi:MAG: T9SS type A sorting domain-containing protein, partial [Bacteroidetes bacterium]|nr:T9SS type A sorting domain-containing protein [Bacteroidota bacterium]